MVEDVFGIIGTTLAGTFRVEEVIAEGGFGVVYRAEHVAFRAPVALKCLKIPGTISPSRTEAFVENFREEAEILFHLSAQIPEVVRPLHADAITLDDGTLVPYLAMEWIDGKPLDSIVILRDEAGLPPLPAPKVVEMLTPIAHALAKAHHFQVPGGAAVSVIHCDLKPENILITDRDSQVKAKVLDFGIAKARDTITHSVGRITDSEESRPFTPSYGAPEQWVPRRYGVSGPWTDVWGLALTMVECLTGQPPIDGDMHAMMGTALDKSRRPTPRTEGAEVSDAVERVFIKALAVDPRDRYPNIESFWTAIEAAVGAAPSFERGRTPASGAVARMADRDDLRDGAGDDFVVGEELDLEPMSGRRPSVRSFRAVDEEEAPPSRGDAGSLAGMAVDSLPPPADIDLDFGSAPPPRSMAASLAARAEADGATSSREGALTRSGTHPAITRSGTHPAPERRRPPAAPMAPPETSLRARLMVPVLLVGVGLTLTALEMFLTRSTGEIIALGPIRFRWMAAALAAGGLILGFWNLIGDRE